MFFQNAVAASKLGRRLSAVFLLCAAGALAQDRIDATSRPDLETTGESCHDNLTLGVETAQPQPGGVRVLLPFPRKDKRLFGLIPNYRAEQAQEVYTPLTTREKFKIAKSDSFDWPNYFLLAGFAVQSQIASSGGFSHAGGIKGFSKFYGRSVADQIIGSYVSEAILPSLLHEDPRFFRLGVGSPGRRAAYAAGRIFIARKDDGGSRFNFSEVLGNVGVVSITSLYYPDSQTVSQGAMRFAMALGNDMISNLMTEFWPDIKRHLPFHKKPSSLQ